MFDDAFNCFNEHCTFGLSCVYKNSISDKDIITITGISNKKCIKV